MVQIVNPELERIAAETDPPLNRPNLAEDITQTFARLWGFDSDNGRWIPVEVDNDGLIRVTTIATSPTLAQHSVPTVDTTSDTVLAANSDRNSYTVFNNGSVTVYLTFGATAVLASGLPLLPNSYISDDSYRGTISGITASGSAELRVVEFS